MIWRCWGALLLLVLAVAVSSAVAADPSHGLGITPELVVRILAEAPCDPASAAPSDPSAEAAREHAWALVRQGRGVEAGAAWAAIVKEQTGTIQAQKALFDLAIHTMETTGDRAAAWQWYRAAAATPPENKALQARARLWEIELYFYADNLKPADGVAALEALGEEWAGQEAQGLAWLRISQYYRDQHDEANLVRWYERAIAAQPRASYVPFAMLTRAEELLGLSPDTATQAQATPPDASRGLRELNRLLTWSDEYGPTRVANEALFLIGKVHADQAQWEEAHSWYLLLAARDPDGEWGAHGEREAAQCALRLGREGDALELGADVSARLGRATWVRAGEAAVWQRDVAEILRQAKATATSPRNRAAVWVPLSERDAAETRGAWPGNGYTTQTQGGCGSNCLPNDDDYYTSKMAHDHTYTDCVAGYFWQRCNQTKTVVCAKWIYHQNANCTGNFMQGDCIFALANNGVTTCPQWPW